MAPGVEDVRGWAARHAPIEAEEEGSKTAEDAVDQRVGDGLEEDSRPIDDNTADGFREAAE